jgi:transforming growth factor-beta-induced protein
MVSVETNQFKPPESTMSRISRRTLLVSALPALAVLSACGGGDDDDPPLPTIAQAATSAGLTALLAAADKAGLTATLQSPATSVTVFAPTDTAFTALATALGFTSATAMVTALPAAALRSILEYHLLGTQRNAAALTGGGVTQPTLYTFAGAAASLGVVTTSGVQLRDAVLTTARVVTADVRASNGIVHVIDKVLVPPGVLNIVQMAQANPDFSSLVAAVAGRGLVPTLSAPGPLTVFAPTNAAFTAAAGVVATLTPAQVSTVLAYHVVNAQVLSSGIPFGAPVATLAGASTLRITAGPAPTIAEIADSTATRARIVAVDIRASNGVIHVIDKVLVPSPL